MRNLDATLQTGFVAPVIEPVLFVLLTFKSSVQYVCSAGFNIAFNGNTYVGLGTFGGISTLREAVELRSESISLTLSGIDPTLVSECENDIMPLAPAKIWFGLMSQGQLIGVPYQIFSGVIDYPSISVGVTDASITLTLASRMALLNRPSQRRYTNADQHANGYSDDTAFQWVEKLNDIALRFGN